MFCSLNLTGRIFNSLDLSYDVQSLQCSRNVRLLLGIVQQCPAFFMHEEPDGQADGRYEARTTESQIVCWLRVAQSLDDLLLQALCFPDRVIAGSYRPRSAVLRY